MAGSNFSIPNAAGGANIAVSPPANDVNGNTVVMHVVGSVVAGVATPASAAAPVPVADATVAAAIAAAAITPPSGSALVHSTAAEASHIMKNAAGSVRSVSALNLTGTAGFLVLLDSATVPADGAIAPFAWAALGANNQASIAFGDWCPALVTNGCVAVLTSAASPFTKTTGVITGAISGMVV